MALLPDRSRILGCYRQARETLLAERNEAGFWTGELSTSALSTATAVMALELVRRAESGPFPEERLSSLVANGLRWLAEHQNADGGWGDTTASFSNVSTTMLCHAVFHAAGAAATYENTVSAAKSYLDRAGWIAAVRARYGKDKTFSIPILTHCALAGLVDWRDVSPLPFELACLPARFYKWVRLPVVSYALPALIAIGQARHHFVKPWNPLARILRWAAIEPSLAILERIQPASGGFLEATPLTSFVTMSLAGMGRADHPVARKGVEFLIRSVRKDGSWPIDTNLATWVTTLSINALGPDVPPDAVDSLGAWLLGQQYRDVHPYTNADPGGWAWTDLPGGVPDADDTPGAILALESLESRAGGAFSYRSMAGAGSGAEDACGTSTGYAEAAPADLAAVWLIDLQNRDGGWPTFCRGWGTMPFDRSAADLTAHALRALACRIQVHFGPVPDKKPPDRKPHGRNAAAARLSRCGPQSVSRGFKYLERTQRPDGSWLPLWFGNQHAPQEENPTYGTCRVLAAYRDTDRMGDFPAQRGLEWLRRAQNADGGWGGAPGIVSSVEETALAAEVFLSLETGPGSVSETSCRALEWLLDRIDRGTWMEPSPIGFYFAKLWYFEKLYPVIFTTGALRRAAALVE